MMRKINVNTLTKTIQLCVFVIIIILPIVMLGLTITHIESFTYFNHLIQHVLRYYISNSFILTAGVMAGTLMLGTSLGWIFSRYDFWGRKVFQYAIFLPLSVPVYLAAYTFDEFLSYDGLLHKFFISLNVSSLNSHWSIEVHSMTAGIIILSLCLNPYVCLFAYASFSRQNQSLGEAAMLLGKSHWSVFWSIYFPRAFPALFSGSILVAFETLNDVGLTEYLGIPGLSAGIFASWLGADAFAEAAILAIILIIICLGLLGIDKFFIHRKFKNKPNEKKENYLKRYRLIGISHFCVIFYVIFIIFTGFGIPVIVLLNLLHIDNTLFFNSDFINSAQNSIMLGLYTVLIVISAALFLITSYNSINSKNIHFLLSLTQIGYAFPGAMLGLGVLSLLVYLNSIFDNIIFTGGIMGLLYVYSIRMLPIGSQYIRSGFRSINPHYAQAARVLGHSNLNILWKIELPLMKKFLFFGCIMIFIDVIKELPATLLLRPFNYETLATHVYNYASSGALEKAAPAGILLIGLSFLPVLLLRNVIYHDK